MSSGVFYRAGRNSFRNEVSAFQLSGFGRNRGPIGSCRRRSAKVRAKPREVRGRVGHILLLRRRRVAVRVVWRWAMRIAFVLAGLVAVAAAIPAAAGDKPAAGPV